MDLNRLRIPERHAEPRSRVWIITVTGLLCLGVGFLLGRLGQTPAASGARSVRTVVVLAGGARPGRGFTAGGWIEVARPVYPLVVSARLAERLEALHVREGQVVQPGELLAELYPRDAASRRDLAAARLEAARRELDKLEAGFRKEERDAAAAEEAEAAERLRIAKANHERSQLLPSGAISREALDQEAAAMREAAARLDLAMANHAKLRAGFRPEEVALAAARVSEARAALDLAERNVGYCRLTAPDLGRPLRVLEVHYSVGEWVRAEKEPDVVSLYDPADLQARVDVTQANIRSVSPGAVCQVVTEADPTRQYRGRVLRVEPLAELAKNTITVRVRIEDPDELLFPEMVAQVTFLAAAEAAEAGGELLVPAESVVQGESGPGVFVVEGDRARRQAVRLGEKRDGRVLVMEGLRSGQRVVTSDPSSLTDGDRIEEE